MCVVENVDPQLVTPQFGFGKLYLYSCEIAYITERRRGVMGVGLVENTRDSVRSQAHGFALLAKGSGQRFVI